jgi:prevent-host-death family protein
MSTHSVAEAKSKLSDLIDRALEGEAVIITRHGNPVAELKPIARALQPLTAADIDWLDDRRVGGKRRPLKDAGRFVSEMRDEDDEK